jgi:hypothetical protein
MKQLQKLILLFLLIGFAPKILLAQNQDSLLKDNVIDVVKTFQPVLSDAIRIPVQPNPEKPEIKKTDFTYAINPAQIAVPPTIYTIKPLALGTMLLPKLQNNYVRIGYGNYNMPLGEIYLGSVRNKQYQVGFFAKHLSGNGDLNYNNFSNNTVYGYFKKFNSKGVFETDAYYHRNAVRLYGGQNDLLPENKEPKLVYNTYDFKTNYHNLSTDSNGLIFRTDLNYYHFNNPGTLQENDVQLKAKLNKTISLLPLELETGLRFNNNKINQPLSAAELDFRRIFFDFNPQIYMKAKSFYLQGGFNATVYADSSNTNTYIFPKAEGGLHLIPSKLTALAGFKGNLQPNTYRSILTENPFVTQMPLLNTINRFEIYGGFKGEITPQLAFYLMGSSAKIENMLFYTFDSANANQIATYETTKATLTTLKAGLNYQWAEKWRSGLNVSIYNYGLNQLNHAYSRPEFETKFNTTYNIGDKFLVKLDIYYWGERMGRSDALKTDGTLNTTDFKMDPFTDLNLGIDYRYNKSFSAFIQFNNIANNRYQRFYAYPVYGINVLGGFTFTF